MYPCDERKIRMINKRSFRLVGLLLALVMVINVIPVSAFTQELGASSGSDKIPMEYTITWTDEDGSDLGTTKVKPGDIPSHDPVTKEEDTYYTYTFSKWVDENGDEPAAAHGNTTYKAVFSSEIKDQPLYNIAKINGKYYRLQKTTIHAEKPIEEYVKNINKDGDQNKNLAGQYTVMPYNFADETISVGGKTYIYAPTDPLIDFKNHYTVANLDPSVVAVKNKIGGLDENKNPRWAIEEHRYDDENTTNSFHRDFEITVYNAKPCEATFIYGNGSKKVQYMLGVTPVYTGPNPTKKSDPQYNYTFNGSWSDGENIYDQNDLPPMSGNVTYTAQFTPEERKYTVKFVDWNNTPLQTDSLTYGSTPVYNGVELPTRAQDSQKVYTFNGWANSTNTYAQGTTLPKVTGDVTFRAQYTSTPREYTVTWTDDDNSFTDTVQVAYGEMPSHDDPVRENNELYSNYAFTGWSPAISTVTKNATYKAQYTKTPTLKSQTLYNMVKTEGQGADGKYYRLDAQTITAKDVSLAKVADPLPAGSYTLDKGEFDFTNVVLNVRGVDYKYSDHDLTGEYDAYYTIRFERVIRQDRINEDQDWFDNHPEGWVRGEATKETYPDYPNIHNDIIAYHIDYIATLHPGTIKYYDVTFVDADGKTVIKEKQSYRSGTTAEQIEKPDNPVKEGYTFVGWDTIPETLTRNVTIKAKYTVNQYTITFKDGDTVIETIKQNYGTAVTAPQDPQKTGFVFDGWDGVVPKTMPAENLTLKAQWAPATNTPYTVNYYLEEKYVEGGYFLNEKLSGSRTGTTDKTVTADVESINGYTFDSGNANNRLSGPVAADGSLVLNLYYSKDPEPLYTTITYKDPVTGKDVWKGIEYQSDADVKNSRLVNFEYCLQNTEYGVKDFDFSELNLVIDGVTYVYRPNGPQEGDQAWYTQDFLWIKKVAHTDATNGLLNGADKTWLSINGKIGEYYTQKKKVPQGAGINGLPYRYGFYHRDYQITLNIKKYTVQWSVDGKIVETDRNVAYGKMPKYNGSAPTKAATARYTYEFTGWDPEISEVTGDVTYVAQFKETTNAYTVEWKNGSTVLETDRDVPYGTTPEYNGTTPVKDPTDTTVYQFSGWSPAISEVTGDATYTAQFTGTPRTYTVAWMNGEETLETDENVPYKATPEYNGTTPVKDPTDTTVYQFSGWSPAISEVTGNATYTAQFTELTKVALTANSDDKLVYTGVSQTVEGFKSSIDGVSFTGITASATGTDATRYTVSFSEGAVGTIDTTGKYIVASVTPGNMVINPAPVTITTGTSSRPYNGEPLTNADVNISGLVNGETATVTATGSITDYGSINNTYSIEWGTTNKDNYAITENLGTLTITTATMPLTVTGYEGTYDGETHSVVVNAPAGSTIRYSVDGGETWTDEVPGITDAGEEVTVQVQVTNSNYDPETREVTLKLDKAPVTITTGSGERMYNGATLTNAEAGITGLVNGETATVTATGTILNAGSATNTYGITWGTAKADNYMITENLGTLEVTPRTVTLTSASDSKAYDGGALTKNTQADVTVGGDGFVAGEGAVYTITGRQTTVGSSDNLFVYTLNPGTLARNYSITPYYGTLTVVEAEENEPAGGGLPGGGLPGTDLPGGGTGTENTPEGGNTPGTTGGRGVQNYTLTITYQTNDGTVLDTFTRTYANGQQYEVRSPERPGYTVDIESVFGTINGLDVSRTVTYTPAAYTLTIYVQSIANGAVVSEPIVRTLVAGEAYSVAIPEVDGYTLLINSVDGVMPASNREITVFAIPAGTNPGGAPRVIQIEDYGTPLGIAESILGSGEIIE